MMTKSCTDASTVSGENERLADQDVPTSHRGIQAEARQPSDGYLFGQLVTPLGLLYNTIAVRDV